jgi:hypothetical protein
MRTMLRGWVIACCVGVGSASAAMAQGVPAPQGASTPQMPVFVGPPPPPATQLEAFKPAIGSILTVGFDDLGDVAGVSVDVREMSDTSGGRARGVVVAIGGRRAPLEQSYVDAEELPELMKGFDALLGITSNPTPFRSFEVRYATKGELVLTAASSRNRGITYTVEVGRPLKASTGPLNAGEVHQLRTFFEAAAQKLATTPPNR